jgi:hypothetical protein
MLQIQDNLRLSPLAEKDRQVRDLHARIDHQQRLIENLAIEGHDTTAAQIILDSLLISLYLQVQDRHRLSAMLSGRSVKEDDLDPRARSFG